MEKTNSLKISVIFNIKQTGKKNVYKPQQP